MIADIPIDSGDPWAFMKAFDYSYISTFFVEGSRFTHNNISLLLYRVLVPLSATDNPDRARQLSLDPAATRLLDGSGGYILQASIRVQDGSKVEIMTIGINELLAFKEMLKGVVDLDMAERLSLDTRVR